MEALPIYPRFATYYDPIENVIYSSNGNLLEKFVNKDNTLVYVEAYGILESGITIDRICKHPKGLIITGDQRIALFCTDEKKVVAKGRHFDHIIAVKSLPDETIVVLTARKKLNVLKITEGGSISDEKSFEMNEECTIFSGILQGDSLEELEVFAGGVLGVIHRHKPLQGPEVLSFYKGHEGMVFGMNILGNKLYSISDDRSLRVYNIETTEEITVVFGHESRIRAVTVSSDEKIFTAGDNICVWEWDDSTLKLSERHEVGIGKIVHLNLIDHLLLGTSINGAFVAVEIKKRQWINVALPALENITVRAFIKGPDGTYFIVDDKKDLYCLSSDGEFSSFIEDQKIRFDSLHLSNSGKFVAAASDNKVFFIEADTQKYSTFVVEEVLGGQFFIDDDLIVLARNGCGIILSSKDGIVNKSSISVPNARGIPFKCGISVENTYIFGTTRGYIVSYEKNNFDQELFSFNISPKNEPVMDIAMIDSQLFVLTRDGKCSVCDKNDEGYQITEVFATTEKPTSFFTVGDKHFIWGFRGPDFVFCPLRSPHPLAVYECGGGNRICKVYPVFENDQELTGIRFEHIVRGDLKIVGIDLSRIQYVVGPYHKATIYGVALVDEGRSVVTAGIDTEILLCGIEKGRFFPKWRSSSHISSIHSLDSTKLRNGTEVVATAGGKSEIRLWKVTKNALHPIALWSCKPDFRYVSIKVRQSVEDDDIVYLFAACSIREIQVFSFNFYNGRFDKLLSYQNTETSTFSKVAVTSDLLTIYAAATSGIVTALSWSPGSTEISFVQSVEALDSGLSAICAVDLNQTNLSKNVCAVGDEGGNFALVDFETESVVLKSEHPHYSTLSDVCFSSSKNRWTLASIATDCHCIVSEFGLTEEGEMKILNSKSFITNVGDPIAILPVNDSTNYLIVGQGVDLIKF